MAFRTQKISQMTPKGANLEATDLIEVSTIESGSYVTRSITGQELIDAIPVPPSGITIGTTAIASGVVGRVLFEGAGNVVQESSSLFWDNTNGRLGIGTSTAPSGSVYIDNSGNDVKQHLVLKNSDAGSGAQVHLDLHNNVAGSSYSSGASLFLCSSTHAAPYASALGFWNYLNGPIALATNSAERMRVAASGNVLIGTTTDAGFRLDVNGTARVSGNFNIATGFELNFNNQNVGIYRSANNLRLGGFGGIEFLSSATTISAQTIRMTLFNTGNFGINTTTDAGFRLDVNGTARVSATDGVSAFQITAPTRAWYFTTSQQGGTFNAISGAANGAAGTGNFGFVINGGWAFNIGLSTSQPNSFFSVYPSATNNGEVRIGGQTGNASSLLTLESTTKGFLPPRMTTTQKNAIASPAAGLMVYDTTLNVISYYNGSMWI